LDKVRRGFGFKLVEAMGVIPRGRLPQCQSGPIQDARRCAAQHGIRFGQFPIFLPFAAEPAHRLRLCFGLGSQLRILPELRPSGLVTHPVIEELYANTPVGYAPQGTRAFGIECWSGLADMLRGAARRGGFEGRLILLSITA